ncbi:MAG: 1-deoxy-D-xylulose-5-phosphate synthase N-terminal domain-containing protein [Pelolinea sp.]|nr:1-deoxy-D-xylulose-5-phosphate synthase N-terminal domain-containing protein [Pelolinea sp.]
MEKRNKIEIADLTDQFHYWEKTKDIIDQLIDIILNYRQSGHPGGSRSKVHILVVAMLSGAMRWDIRHPEKRFADRFILAAGHTVPLIYCTLAALNEVMRIKYRQTKDERYAVAQADLRALYWEDLLEFRRRGGLSGHAEVVDKSLFLKFNTGPSGHGTPAAAGEALALKRAGAGSVRVFALEGEAGLTPGIVHETLNSAWGLKLDNLIFLVDWNDFGIDDHKVSDVVFGTPEDWFAPHGWRVFGTENGSEWVSVTETLLALANDENSGKRPGAAWFKTRKGRGYLKYDNKSHGSPHAMDSDIFWETKKEFSEKYGANFYRNNEGEPKTEEEIKKEFSLNLQAVIKVLEDDRELVDYLAERLVDIGESVPEEITTFELASKKNPFEDDRIYDYEQYPADIFAKPGEMVANRAALAKWGAWINAFGAKEYNRPLFLACSADLAGSTNISGFAGPYSDFGGYGWYGLGDNNAGVLLPQEITEFANAGLMVGMAATNMAENPSAQFNGFWGACSTYGSFSYLKYGMFRIFSQLVQDSPWKLGKVIWIAGHSGPETADDSRTHFGIFAPGVTQLFPKGSVINLHPWEHNEVPVLLGAALRMEAPIIALHLTRPNIEVPDRKALRMPSHFESAKGAYIIQDHASKEPKDGTLIVQGTSAVANILKILPDINKKGWNLKIICATSSELFDAQSEQYRKNTISKYDRLNSTVITTQAGWLMHDWIFNPLAEEYALSADWDGRWRTGGTLEEVIEEAHLSPEWLLKGIERYDSEKEKREAFFGRS